MQFKLVTITAVVLLFSCAKHEEKDTLDPFTLDDAVRKVDGYVSQIHLVQDKYGFVGTRCDSLVFSSLLKAYEVNVPLDLFQSEQSPGKWVRHPEPCYPHDSRSQISLDGYLGLLHYLWSSQDLFALQRIIDYGKAHKWIMGEGPREYTNILGLVPIIYEMRNRMSEQRLMGLTANQMPILKGHKGHIIAVYILLVGRVTGKINSVWLAVLKDLARNAPDNPLFQSIYHRYSDGDQSKVVKLVKDMPYDIPTDLNAYHWGSSPRFLFAVLSVGVAKGW